jgi:hypothetical protein
MVPSDPIPSLTLRRHARHRALRSESPGGFRFAPRRPFGGDESLLADPPAGSSARNRRLTTTFRSLRTTSRFRATVPRSKLPACRFGTPLHLLRTRSAGYSRRPCRLASGTVGINAANPLPDSGATLPAAPQTFRSPPGPCPSGSPRRPICRRKARLPNPPDLPSLPASSIFIGALADHRSRLATFPEACCSSNLLEPSP